MEILNLKLVTDEQVTQSQPQAAMEVLADIPLNLEAPKLIRTRTPMHLNVDAVLARSLPKLTVGSQKSGKI